MMGENRHIRKRPPTSAVSADDDKGPGVICPPPAVFTICGIGAYILHLFMPLNWSTTATALGNLRVAGIVLVLFALLILAFLVLQFFHARTSIEPWKPASQLLTSGLYAYSRNLIYLTFCVLLGGISLIVNSIWVGGSVMMAAWLVQRLAIVKEEAYLQRRFGAAYVLYRSRVRRWF